MISIKKNNSFPKWIQVFAFGQFIDEVEGRAKALRIATKLAKENKQTHINVLGKVQEVQDVY
jgi:ribosomal protein L39E